MTQGVEELAQEKLGALITLKYGSTTEAAAKLGGVPAIVDAFDSSGIYMTREASDFGTSTGAEFGRLQEESGGGYNSRAGFGQVTGQGFRQRFFFAAEIRMAWGAVVAVRLEAKTRRARKFVGIFVGIKICTLKNIP